MKKALFISFFILSAAGAHAQKKNAAGPKRELALMAGTIQPFVLQGGNVEMDFYTPRLVFNYSHGFSLDLDSRHGTTTGAVKAQSLAIHLPYSTGFGVGYRLNKYFDVRLEPKLHQFDVFYDGTDRKQPQNKVAGYKTFTLGAGCYFRWKPFEKQDNLLKGIFTSTSLRYWPKVWTSLDDNKVQYFNRVTGKTEIHEAANIGIANTPFIFNVAIGYSIVF